MRSQLTPRGKRHASWEIARERLAKRPCTRTSPKTTVSPLSNRPPQTSPLSLVSTPSSECTLFDRTPSECPSDTQSSIGAGPSRSPLLTPPGLRSEVQITVYDALSTQIQILKSEVQKLKVALREAKRAPFRVESISHDGSPISLHTGFPSYDGSAVIVQVAWTSCQLTNILGHKEKTLARRRKKLDSLNQLFLTPIKLKLDLNIRDLAFRFQISTTTVSRYFITVVCFMHNELKELIWFPTKEQVAGTLPH